MAASVFHVRVIPTEPRPHKSFPPSEKSTFRVWTVCSHEKGAFILPPTKSGGSGSKWAMLRVRRPTLLAELAGLDGCCLEGQQLQRGQLGKGGRGGHGTWKKLSGNTWQPSLTPTSLLLNLSGHLAAQLKSFLLIHSQLCSRSD